MELLSPAPLRYHFPNQKPLNAVTLTSHSLPVPALNNKPQRSQSVVSSCIGAKARQLNERKRKSIMTLGYQMRTSLGGGGPGGLGVAIDVLSCSMLDNPIFSDVVKGGPTFVCLSGWKFYVVGFFVTKIRGSRARRLLGHSSEDFRNPCGAPAGWRSRLQANASGP